MKAMEKTLRKKRERICLRSPFAVVPEPSAFVLFVLGTLLLFGKDFRARLTITLATSGACGPVRQRKGGWSQPPL